MNLHKLNIGRIGEKLAVDFLLQNNYTILEKNFRTKSGEIDIIAQKNNKISFVEVKTRIGLKKGYPYEAVDKRKVLHVKNCAQFYLLKNPHKDSKLSVDVVSIVLNDDLTVNKLHFFEGVEL